MQSKNPIPCTAHNSTTGFNPNPMRKKRGQRSLGLPPSTPVRTAEDVVDGLRQLIKRSTRSYFAIGKQLILRKQEVGHGQFKKLFKDQPDCIANPLPMSLRQAQRHMQIAKNSRIRRHFHSLPSDLTTLCRLTKLTKAAFDEGIRTGRIHDTLTREQAEALLEETSPKPETPSANKVRQSRIQGTKPRRRSSQMPKRPGPSESVISRKVLLAMWQMLEEFQAADERAAAITALDAIRATLR